MKTMKKIVCALMTLVLLLSSVPAVFADEAKTSDQDAACSLTVWKFDYTNARKDGVWDEDAFPSTGWQESYVENTLVNTNRKGDTDGQNGNALGNGQTSLFGNSPTFSVWITYWKVCPHGSRTTRRS